MRNVLYPALVKQSRRKSILLSLVVAALAAGLIWMGVWWYRSRPPRPTSDRLRVAQYVASDKFDSLSEKEQAPYLEALSGLSREERQQVMRNLNDEQRGEVMFQTMAARERKLADAYYMLKTPLERKTMLDKQIDEMEDRMAAWRDSAATRPARTRPPVGTPEAGPTSRPGGGARDGRPQQPMEQRIKQRQERLPAEQRAKWSQYRYDLRQRMEARGIQPPTFRGGGPGGPAGGLGGRGR